MFWVYLFIIWQNENSDVQKQNKYFIICNKKQQTFYLTWHLYRGLKHKQFLKEEI